MRQAWPSVRARASDLLDLAVFQLHRGRTAEDRDADLHAAAFLVHFLHRAVEAGERPVGHAHLLADFEQDRRARPLHPFGGLLHDPLGLGIGDRRGARLAAQEAGHLRRVLHQVPRVVGQFHLHQHVAGKELALGGHLLATAQLHHLLGGHQHLVELVGQALLGGLFLDLLGDLLLEARINVDHIPTLRHDFVPQPATPNSARTPTPMIWSMMKKKIAARVAMATTRPVVTSVSLRAGHVTLVASLRTSRTNRTGSKAKRITLPIRFKPGAGARAPTET